VFQKLARLEDCILRLPQAEQRGALMAAGAPLTSDTLGTSTARRGVARYA
jgi:glutathione S-transferase